MIKYYSIFLKNKGSFKPLASLIRFIECLEFNHVEILEVTNDDYANAKSYGVTFSGSRAASIYDVATDYELKEIIELNIKSENPRELLTKLIGVKYSFLQMGLVGIKISLKSIGKILSNLKVNGQNGLICTEETALFISSACNYELDQSPEMYSLRETRSLSYKNMTEGFQSDSLKIVWDIFNK